MSGPENGSQGPLNNSSDKYQKLFDEAQSVSPAAEQSAAVPAAPLDRTMEFPKTVTDIKQAEVEAHVMNPAASKAAEKRAEAEDMIQYLGQAGPDAHPQVQANTDNHVLGQIGNKLTEAAQYQRTANELGDTAGEVYKIVKRDQAENPIPDNAGQGSNSEVHNLSK